MNCKTQNEERRYEEASSRFKNKSIQAIYKLENYRKYDPGIFMMWHNNNFVFFVFVVTLNFTQFDSNRADKEK